MASIGWRSQHPVSTLLFERYGQFNVFQLLRLLQWKPGQRRLRYTAELSAAFPGREIAQLDAGPAVPGQAQTVALRTANYCVASVLGPLPEPYTEWLRDLDRARAPAMGDFLNIFNQRLNVLRFELKQRQTMALNSAAPESTAQAHYLAALMGLGQSQLAEQVALPPRQWLSLAGLLGNCRRSAAALTQVLGHYLRAPVQLDSMVGAWQQIEAQDRLALARRNQQLGRRSVLGRRVWDQQARIRLRIGPLDYAAFSELLPPNLAERRHGQLRPGYRRFLGLLQLMLDRLHDCEVVLELDDAAPAPSCLTRTAGAHGAMGLRLGQSAWLRLSGGAASAAPPRRARYLVPAYGAQGAP